MADPVPTRVRAFSRADREQLTRLVNAHVAAVLPGGSLSVQQLLSSVEREPGEIVVDPWVVERVTLVAEQRDRVVAGAHVLRYDTGPAVGPAYRGAGEVRWLVCEPEPFLGADGPAGTAALAATCLALFRRWGVAAGYADGTLPVPGVYGVPEQWPHVRSVYDRAGFRGGQRVEVVLVAEVDALRRPAASAGGLVARRSVGVCGTRISAVLDGEVVGYVEVDTVLDPGTRTSRVGAWADVGNLHVVQAHRRRGVGCWLVARAADWLALAGVTRLLDYAAPDDAAALAFLRAVGFTELTRTVRDLALVRAD